MLTAPTGPPTRTWSAGREGREPLPISRPGCPLPPSEEGTLRLPPLACERLARATEGTMLDLQAGEPAAE